jgi:peptidoglycan/xylan/chitin deacetylase (PgdA/CDA1 family)
MILCYHGITTSRSIGIENFSRKHLPRFTFKQHIQWLADSSCEVITMESFLARLPENACSSREIVLTFDDGYKNHYETVWPLLKQYGMPFTVFISSGFLNQDRFFWVDLVEHWFNRTKASTVQLLFPEGYRTWPCTNNQEKIKAVIEIKKILKKMKPLLRNEILGQLQDQTQVDDPPADVENYCCMSWNDLYDMSRDPLVTIGAHTVNHEILSNLSVEEMEFEIVESRRILERALGCSILSFAYPNGKPEDYSQASIDILQSAGYSCAFKVVPDPAPNCVQRYSIPRVSDYELGRFMESIRSSGS